jgi:hypothetical protein
MIVSCGWSAAKRETLTEQKRRIKMKKTLIILVMAFCLCGTAWATIITQTKNFSGTPNMLGSSTFNQFDNTGGFILNSVHVKLYLQATGGQLILDNDSNLPASGTFEFGAKGTISSTDVTLLNSSAQPIPGEVAALNSQGFNLEGNVGDGSGDYDPCAPDGLLYTGVTQDDAKSDFVWSAVWGLGAKGFQGTGTYDIDYAINQWLTYGSIGGIEYAVNPVNANGYVEVSYDYTIPEPATISLLGLGVLSLLRRKRSV